MPSGCQITGCKSDVPAELSTEALCTQHYTLHVETRCQELRRETAATAPEQTRRQEILHFLTITGERLSRIAIGNARLADEMKARILSTFLTLMNLRESLDRAAARGAAMAQQAPAKR
jgi:hypothetical protein